MHARRGTRSQLYRSTKISSKKNKNFIGHFFSPRSPSRIFNSNAACTHRSRFTARSLIRGQDLRCQLLTQLVIIMTTNTLLDLVQPVCAPMVTDHSWAPPHSTPLVQHITAVATENSDCVAIAGGSCRLPKFDSWGRLGCQWGRDGGRCEGSKTGWFGFGSALVSQG